VAYTYDPFGRRIKKDENGTVTYFIYSDEGLVGEYAQDGTNVKTYSWQPNSTWGTDPVFMTIGADTYYFHNDHLGTPQKLTDESGNVVWSATYSAFGMAVVGPASTITNNLRYPGQYFDEQTGLNYNWQRYYDPAKGRYISEDPVEFGAKDANLYRYTSNNPINKIDARGLSSAYSGSFGGGATLGAGWGEYSFGFSVSVSVGFNIDSQGNRSYSIIFQGTNWDDFKGMYGGFGVQAGGSANNCMPPKGWSSNIDNPQVTQGFGVGTLANSIEASESSNDEGVSFQGGGGRIGKGLGGYVATGRTVTGQYTW